MHCTIVKLLALLLRSRFLGSGSASLSLELSRSRMLFNPNTDVVSVIRPYLTGSISKSHDFSFVFLLSSDFVQCAKLHTYFKKSISK